ncbi:MAG: hypothetical protein ACFB51_01110 [Anaerolineae bacterium]
MGIQMEWEFEEDRGLPPKPDQQPPTPRSSRMLIIGVLVVGLAALVAVVIANRHVEATRSSLRDALEAAVYAETLALRLGDRDAFLAMQAADTEWRRSQRWAFDQYVAFSAQLDVTGEIVSLDVSGGSAAVTLVEYFEGERFEVTWYYIYTDGSWLHSPPPGPPQTGTARLQTDTFDIRFRETDRAVATALAKHIDGWWEQALRIMDMPDVRHEVLLDMPIPPTVGTAAMFSVDLPPSTQPPWLATDEAADLQPVLEQLTAAWVERHLYSSRETGWLTDELTDYLRARIEPGMYQDTTTGFLEGLAYAQGGEPLVVTEPMETNEQIGAFIRSQSPAEMTAQYAEGILRAEAALRENDLRIEANAIFRDPERAETRGMAQTLTVRAQPGSIDVDRLARVGDIMWARVTYANSPNAGRPPGEYTGLEAFRLTDAGWSRTTPVDADYGPTISDSAAPLTITYQSAEADQFQVILRTMQIIYSQTAEDFGLTEAPSARVVFTPDRDRVYAALYDEVEPLVPFEVTVHTTPNSLADEAALAEYDAFTQLIGVMAAYQAGVDPYEDFSWWWRRSNARQGDLTPYTFSQRLRPGIGAITRVQLGVVGGYPTSSYYLDRLERDPSEANVPAPTTLAILWPAGEPFGNDSVAYELGAHMLIGLLVEEYGPEAFPIMLDTLYESSNIFEWLEVAFEMDRDTMLALQAEWQQMTEGAWAGLVENAQR